MENYVNQGGFDEFGCFHISDFEIGDAIMINTEAGKIRGLVSGVLVKSNGILYRSRAGEGTCYLNDICFLSGSERGWLGNA